MIVWAVHDGGYDADTWYWGALLLLETCGVLVIARRRQAVRTRGARVAVIALGLYVAWSFISIAWAGSPGDALDGSNRALLYLLIFTVMLLVPWTGRGLTWALVVFAAAVGLIAIVVLARFASADRVGSLVIDGRLAAPTGYFNSTAALFTIDALLATALAGSRSLPGIVRGGLLAAACASIQLALVVQSRGWLFTLPLVLVVALVVVRHRLRFVAAAAFPVAAALIPLHWLLNVYQSQPGAALDSAARSAGRAGLVICVAAFVLGTIAAWADQLWQRPQLPARRSRQIGVLLAAVVAAGTVAGGLAATHGHPLRFIQREWNGFSHPTASASGDTSHFGDVGSGRYDFWRVSLDALASHPLGGLGQDNFADYYITRRRTAEEPSWTHSLELRLLAHTGLIGFGLFAVFLAAAVAVARRGRAGGNHFGDNAASIALLPLVVWLIHGSVDWFWELPALTGPALGFLGASMAVGDARANELARQAAGEVKVLWRRPPRRAPSVAAAVLAATLLASAAVALGLPYVAVRLESTATDMAATNPSSALSDLKTAASLDPLSSIPGRLGGRIALAAGDYEIAEQRFSQAMSREPGGWFAWFGDGLAASELGDVPRARHDFAVAARIDDQQPVIREALARVDTQHPMTPAQALRAIVLA
jgi:hypothetical protein